MLNPNEKIDSWDVVVRTTEGRELEFMKDFHLEIPYKVARTIDDILEAEYPVTWLDERGGLKNESAIKRK